jgi:DNA-binding GntR family transcriptional regulator
MTTEDRERQLMAAIKNGRQAKGYAPSMRELAKAMGVSLTRVAQLMARCEHKGLITRHRNVARSIVVAEIEPAGKAKPTNQTKKRPARGPKTTPAK